MTALIAFIAILVLCGPHVFLAFLTIVALYLISPELLGVLFVAFMVISATFIAVMLMIGFYDWVVLPIARAVMLPYRWFRAR